jgi:hypothetical protein
MGRSNAAAREFPPPAAGVSRGAARRRGANTIAVVIALVSERLMHARCLAARQVRRVCGALEPAIGLAGIAARARPRTGPAPPALRSVYLTLAVSLIAPLVQAETARARLGVSVTVLPRAAVRSESLPLELEISPADIRRGYVERRRATQLTVGNAGPVGFVLDVLPTARIFSLVEISTSDQGKTTVGTEGGQLVGWHGARSGEAVVLDFRFKLLPGIAPGRYPWPVRLDARLDY